VRVGPFAAGDDTVTVLPRQRLGAGLREAAGVLALAVGVDHFVSGTAFRAPVVSPTGIGV
jgi:hypothetical protein